MVEKKLVLIGAPCSGKTTLAREYAIKTGKKYCDTDEMFEARFGDIAAYFDSRGERAFREEESKLVFEAAASDCAVVACGGGAVLNDRAMCALRAVGNIVRLVAPVDVLERRMRHSSRPLKNVRELIAARENKYALYADGTVDVSHADPLAALIAAENRLRTHRKNRYDVLLCDADDTVLDFKRAMRLCVTGAAREVGITASDGRILAAYGGIVATVWHKLERKEITRAELNGMRFGMLARELGVTVDTDRFAEIYTEMMCKTRFVIDGALEFLTSVRARGIKVYIITNGFTHIAVHRLKALDGYCDGAFISEQVGFDKPDPRFFDEVFAAIGDPPRERTLVMGDSVTSDIAGGLSCGAHTCLFDRTRSLRSDAHYAASDYSAVLDIL